MNRVIGITSIVLVAVLTLLIVILSSFRSSSTNNTTAISPIPTSVVDFNSASQDFPEVDSEGEIDSLLTQDDKNKLALFNAKLPPQSSDFSMDYSDLLNQYFIEDKQSSQSAQQIDAFLSENGVSDIFRARPELLTRGSLNATQQRSEAEERYRFTIKKFSLKTTPQTPKKEPKEVQALFKLFDIMTTFDLGSSTSQSATSQPPASISNVVIGDTSKTPCEAGSDAGVQDGYAKGQLYKIRVCNIQGITVNAQISDEVNRLLTAAKGAGLPISGGGFRTMERQISMYESRCGSYDFNNPPSRSCSPYIARPGFSNHQMGVAIDFTCSGSTLTPSSPCFSWLVGNARNYGLINYEKEAWHWSINGN
mgnify:CR=1 FL=1